MKKIKFIITLLILFVLFKGNAFTCTIFTANDSDVVMAGNNEDFFYDYSSDMWFVAADDESYGRICFANSHYIQGGMNEKGLFYDGASCPATSVPHSEGKRDLGMDLGNIVLSKCADVNEAVDFLEEYNIPRNFGDHLLIADQTGSSAIIEWVEDEMRVVRNEKKYQIATNFFVTDPDLGGYPCSRYETVERMLEDEERLSVGRFEKILASAAQQWDGGGTKYSNIYDLKNKVVYVYSKGDFSRNLEFGLDKELKKLGQGDRVEYDIDELISKLPEVSAPGDGQEEGDTFHNTAAADDDSIKGPQEDTFEERAADNTSDGSIDTPNESAIDSLDNGITDSSEDIEASHSLGFVFYIAIAVAVIIAAALLFKFVISGNNARKQ